MFCAGALVTTLMLVVTPASKSFYSVAPADPKAVYLNRANFPVAGDGVADDTAAIQSAIDQVQQTTGQGILFIPEGRFRLTKTLVVWPGIRLIGCGAHRPVFVLGENTPGYQDTEKYMVFFAGRRPEGPTAQPQVPETAGRDGGDLGVSNDANPGTFYSAMSNIDLEIKPGNPAAVGIRGRYAQHCYLAHMDFRLESGLAAIHDTGNEAEDLRFFGGEFGIITRTPSPGWQYTLLDSYFEGQKQAAIRTRVTGLTLIRPTFKNVPSAISVDPGFSEQLWMKDGRLEDVSGPALAIGKENSPRTQINLEDVACHNVPTFALFRESGRKIAGRGDTYLVKTFSHGLRYPGLGQAPKVGTELEAPAVAEMPASAASDVPPLPPTESWFNVMSAGAKGDGLSDDTAALREAIGNHQAIYLPLGKYRVTDTIALRPDTVLIGLNPITTQIVLKDGTPGFVVGEEGGSRRFALPFAGDPKPLLETPKGGTNIVTGIGLDTGGNNLAAVGAKWMAGKDSMMEDVKFIGGHGSGAPIYNSNNTADPDPARRWDSQYPSLWVTEGGGGTFKNIWTASTFAQAGMMVSDTTTEGRVYQLSSEHHVRHEVQIRRASNWSFVALQTEEERGEGPFALPLEIDRSSNITIANLNMYRVVSVVQPFPYAVKVRDSSNIRFRGAHCYSNSKASFDNLLIDESHGIELRQREFAWLDLKGDERASHKGAAPIEKLAGGFFNISGGALAPNGDFYFVDARWNRIYRWDVKRRQIELVQDSPLSPTNLIFDDSGNLMVVSYGGRGTVYSFRPEAADGAIRVIKAEPATVRPGRTPVLPVTDWLPNPAIVAGQALSRPYQFVSPDGSTFLATGRDFVDGALTYGIKLEDVIRSFGLAKAAPGKPFYVTGESEMRTYSVVVEPDGTLTHPKMFAEQGGEGIAVDGRGNVYIAAGQIFVYSPNGRLIDTIEVPERPTQLVFGKDGRTLYITARTSLYAVQVRS